MSSRRGARSAVVLCALLLVGLAIWGLWPAPAAPLPTRAVARRAPLPIRQISPVVMPAAEAPPAPKAPFPVHPPAAAPLPVDLVEEAADTGAPGRGLVLVEVYDEDGQRVPMAQVVSVDCEVASPTGIDGRAALSVPLGTCSFQARRRDGLLFARSEWVEVRVLPDGNRPVELVLPAERAGGLGVGIFAREDGIEIRFVQPGSPAERMGLAPGDLIVEVDGLPTDTLDIDEFIEVMTGPEGSEVDFVIEHPDDTGDGEAMTLTRAFITG